MAHTKLSPDLIAAFRWFKANACQQSQTALMLAKAEQWAEQQGVTFHWQGDDEPWDPGDTDYTPTEVLGCIARSADGEVLASLWGIADPDRNYGRVIEAELASEAFSDWQAKMLAEINNQIAHA